MTSAGNGFRLVRFGVGAFLAASVWAASPSACRAQAPAADGKPPIGRYIRVESPIAARATDRVRQIVLRFVEQVKKHGDGRPPILVFEIESGSTPFLQAFELAKFIAYDVHEQLPGVRTVAYVPDTLNGHAVLAALACQEIVMHRDGPNETTTLGNAGQSEAVDAVMVAAYRQITQAQNTVPLPVALKMLDKRLEVLQVRTDKETTYALRSAPSPDIEDFEDLKARGPTSIVKVVSPAGVEAVFTTAEAQERGFVSQTSAADRAELLHELGLSRESLEEDPSLDGGWRTARIDIKGAITPEMIAKAEIMIESQIRDHGTNFFCVWIDSPGGAPVESMRLANRLAGLDPTKHRTAAYIPHKARGDAAAIALACDQIVMHARAELGGDGEANIDDANIEVVEKTFRQLATDKYHSPALAAAMINPKVEVFRYKRRDKGWTEFMTDAEAAALADAARWEKGERIGTAGHPLVLLGTTAEEYGVAHAVVGDFGKFKAIYGLEHDPQLIEPGWAIWFIEALRAPALSWLLLLIGGAALYAELHTPGIGIGGFISAVCFVLYFWSRFLGGTAGWLEVLLFTLGALCVLLEIFVFPGTAIFGLGGGILVIASLVLASQTFVIPRNDYQFEQLQDSLLVLVGAIGGSVVSAALLRRFLPHAPMFNRMLLAPPRGAELMELARREALGQFEHLRGGRGSAYTPLVPGGKARIGEQLVDVVSEGDFIDRGTPVEVVEVQGTRIVVRQIG